MLRIKCRLQITGHTLLISESPLAAVPSVTIVHHLSFS